MPGLKTANRAAKEPATFSRAAAALAEGARDVAHRAALLLASGADAGPLRELAPLLGPTVAPPAEPSALADALAQTAVCALFARRLLEEDDSADPRVLRAACRDPLVAGIFQLLEDDDERTRRFRTQLGLDEAALQVQRLDLPRVRADFQRRYPGEDLWIHFYEQFLAHYDRRGRRGHGVFFTPHAVVTCLVASADEALREEFGLADGLADTTTWGELVARFPGASVPAGVSPAAPFVQIRDPAAGTGTFLVEAIRCVHRTLTAKWRAATDGEQQVRRRWNEYVPRGLLPRLGGVEILPAPYFMAQLRLWLALAETGYDLDGPGSIDLRLADALAQLANTAADTSADEPGAIRPTVMLANPPYSGISRSGPEWIERLLRGTGPRGEATGSYYRADGRPLGEKKLWLRDDYVKFLRLYQWQIEAAGGGVVAVVSNHGYLDNPTFRGLRQCLVEAFDAIDVVDLHGNLKKKERAPDGRRDASVFLTEQGVALGLFVRQPGANRASRVRFGELWGTRGEKCQGLADATVSRLAERPLAPAAPLHLLVPRDESHAAEYERGFRLPDIMPIGSTAAVTARDHLVVAFERQELLARIARFRDPAATDGELREAHFPSPRTGKYPPGDTRGWQLAEARRVLAADERWAERVLPVWYRPLDRRVIFWSPDMIDWPRGDVTRHMREPGNLALVVRRQMLPTQACNYFWISDGPVIDGLIRSDNRGSESFFPLYVRPEEETRSSFLTSRASEPAGPREAGSHEPARAPPRANFAPPFIDEAAALWGLEWTPHGSGDLRRTLGPVDLLRMIYATFHSHAYRTRYAEFLRADFPRVFLPREVGLLRALCERGEELAMFHVKHLVDGTEPAGHAPRWQGAGPAQLAAGYPRFDGGAIELNPQRRLEGVSRQAWEFRAGAHQPCRKWLKDRRGRKLSAEDCRAYEFLVTAVERTLAAAAAIDRAIADFGGWPGAWHVAALTPVSKV